MKFLANENFLLCSVRLLRQANYDVASITEDSPGIADTEVLIQAAAQQRIILTFDRDYGELIYRLRLRSPKGVIYLRFRPHTPEEPASLLLSLLRSESLQFENWFTVVEREQIRQRPLPTFPPPPEPTA
jgi:predicted nuclease of predicted toxin-antitoxin system